MDVNGQPQKPDPSAQAAALVTGQIVMANMTFYVVDETKLDNLSARNDESKTFFATSAGLASLAIGLFCNQFFTDNLSDKGWMVAWVVAPILLVLSGVAVCLGWKFSQRSNTVLADIKKNKAVTSVQLTVGSKQAV